MAIEANDLCAIGWISSKVHSVELLYAESRITIKRTRLT